MATIGHTPAACAVFAIALAVNPALSLDCAYEIPSTGAWPLGPNGHIDVTGLVAPGTAFNFYGVDYGPAVPGGRIRVHEHGYVTFGTEEDVDSDPFESLKDLSSGPPTIAALWDEQFGAGSIKAEVQYDPYRLVITWDGSLDADYSAPNFFQLTLYIDSDDFEIVYNGITTTDGLVGVSRGGPGESDLSATRRTKGSRSGTVAELFTYDAGDQFDLDGNCLHGKPLPFPDSKPVFVLN